MQEEREISLKAVFYTIAKKWKLLLIIFLVVFVGCYGFFWFRSGKPAATATTTTTTATGATAVALAEKVDPEDIQKAKENAEHYKKYLENSEYMKLDTNALHQSILYYALP